MVLLILLPVPAASAHPLGNFTVNTHVGLRVEPGAVLVRVVVDSAEIPTVQAFPDGRPADGASGFTAYRDQECRSVTDDLVLSVDGAEVAVQVRSTSLEFPAGAGGLPTTRLTCDGRASDLDTVGSEVSLLGTPAQGRVGWHEVVAVGDGVTLASSDVPSRSVSEVLRAYPEDLLKSPLEQTGATLTISEGSGTPSGAGAGEADVMPAPSDGLLGSLTDRFTQLVGSPDLTVGLAFLSFVAAVVLGAIHAFAPGHGKALMAAYLVGQDGSWRQAMLIGTSVTVTHTAGVLVLGVVLSTVAVTAPERVYPYLGLASGLLVCGIGITLVRRALTRNPATARTQSGVTVPHDHVAHDHVDHDHHANHDSHADHEHPHPHSHAHPDATTPSHGRDLATADAAHRGVVHSHGSGPAHTHSVATDARGLLAVGFAGGLVPAPSAVVVLLGGIALGRAWFGVLLVLAYGIGMSLALAGTGLLLVHARRRIQTWALRPDGSGRGLPPLLTHLPLLTAAFVVAVGLGLAARALSQVL